MKHLFNSFSFLFSVFREAGLPYKTRLKDRSFCHPRNSHTTEQYIDASDKTEY